MVKRNKRHLQPALVHICSPETVALRRSHTLMLSHPLRVLPPPHTIPCVSLVCSCTESLSQLSLYGLKLPGQVYSTVSPCAAGPGRVKSSWILSQPPTHWHRWPHFTIPSPYTRTKISPAGGIWGNMTHWSLAPFTDFYLAAHFFSVMCQRVLAINYTHRQKLRGCSVINFIWATWRYTYSIYHTIHIYDK